MDTEVSESLWLGRSFRVGDPMEGLIDTNAEVSPELMRADPPSVRCSERISIVLSNAADVENRELKLRLSQAERTIEDQRESRQSRLQAEARAATAEKELAALKGQHADMKDTVRRLEEELTVERRMRMELEADTVSLREKLDAERKDASADLMSEVGKIQHINEAYEELKRVADDEELLRKRAEHRADTLEREGLAAATRFKEAELELVDLRKKHHRAAEELATCEQNLLTAQATINEQGKQLEDLMEKKREGQKMLGEAINRERIASQKAESSELRVSALQQEHEMQEAALDDCKMKLVVQQRKVAEALEEKECAVMEVKAAMKKDAEALKQRYERLLEEASGPVAQSQQEVSKMKMSMTGKEAELRAAQQLAEDRAAAVESARSENARLREEMSVLKTKYNDSASDITLLRSQKGDLNTKLQETTAELKMLRMKTSRLESEMGTAATLAKMSREPMHTMSGLEMPTPLGSPAPVPPTADTKVKPFANATTKRAAPEPALELTFNANVSDTKKRAVERIFTATGLDGPTSVKVAEHVEKLKNGARFVQLKPNVPVPLEVSHLVTSGQLTVKLLTAAVRGCWILRKEYVEESEKAGVWMDERSFGFRHVNPPLKGKTMAITKAFHTSRHFSTVSQIAKEGGAVVSIEGQDDGFSMHAADMVMHTPSESMSATVRFKGYTWENLVKELYPEPLV